MGEINQKKRLHKKKKTWFILGTTMICGALVATDTLANRMDQLLSSMKYFVKGEEESPLDQQSFSTQLGMKLDPDAFQKLESESSQSQLMTSQVQSIGKTPDSMSEVLPPEGGGSLAIPQSFAGVSSSVPFLSEIVREISRLAELPAAETVAKEEASPRIIEKVVEHVKEVAPEIVKVEDPAKAEQLKEIKAKADALLKEQEKRENEIQRLNATVGEKEEIIKAREKALKSRQDNIDELKGRIEFHKDALKEKEKELSELENKIKQGEDEVSELEREYKLTTDETKRDEIQSRIKQIGLKLQAEEKVTLQKSITKTQKQIDLEQEKLDSELSKYQEEKEVLKALEAELVKRKATVQSTRKELKKLIFENRVLKGEIEPSKTDITKNDDYVIKKQIFEDGGTEFVLETQEKLKSIDDIFAQLSSEMKDQMDPFHSNNLSIQKAADKAKPFLEIAGNTQEKLQSLSELMIFLNNWLTSLSLGDKTRFPNDICSVNEIVNIWVDMNSEKSFSSMVNSKGETYNEKIISIKEAIHTWRTADKHITDNDLFLILNSSEALKFEQMLETYKQEGKVSKEEKEYNGLHTEIEEKLSLAPCFKEIFSTMHFSLNQLRRIKSLINDKNYHILQDMESLAIVNRTISTSDDFEVQILVPAEEKYAHQQAFYKIKDNDSSVKDFLARVFYFSVN